MTNETQNNVAQEVVAFPQLNKPAPAFDAPTTHGNKTLGDYKGRWLVLFSHPEWTSQLLSTSC